MTRAPVVRTTWVGGIEVLLVSLAPPPAIVRQAVACLDAGELARAARFAREADARRFVVAHGVVRRELGTRLGLAPASLAIVRARTGKPHIAGCPPPLHFSLSHAGDLALVAISRTGPVGVDLELHDDDAADGLTAWTRREALGKATGEGLVSGDRLSHRGWTVHTFEPIPGSIAALAHRS